MIKNDYKSLILSDSLYHKLYKGRAVFADFPILTRLLTPAVIFKKSVNSLLTRYPVVKIVNKLTDFTLHLSLNEDLHEFTIHLSKPRRISDRGEI